MPSRAAPLSADGTRRLDEKIKPDEIQGRIEAMLEVLAKLTSAHRARLPPEISTQLANAVAGCKPPERSAMVAEVAPHPSPSPNPSL